MNNSRYFLNCMNRKYTKKRLREIISVSIKYGLKKGITDPKQFKVILEELGPTFVKIGQILSTRPDIFPQEYIYELQKLQDNVKPEKYEIIKKVVETELNSSIEKTFIYFEKEPIASASLAQVHFAKLKTGENVVVKVQRPNIKEKMVGDIAILKKFAPFINLTAPGSAMDMREVVDELANATQKELNFLIELQNIKNFKENNKDVKFIICPDAYEKYSTNKILVMDYIDGIKIDNIEKLKEQGYEINDIANKLIYNYFKQIFEDGFFHADPHPGNILIHENKIGYLDFGLMGNLNNNLRKKFNQFLIGVTDGDTNLMTKTIFRIGKKRGVVNMKKLHSDIDFIYNKYIEESIHEFDLPEMMNEVFKICKKNNIYMPKDVTLLIKGLMTLQGIISELDDEINIMDIALPYVRNHLIKQKFSNIDVTKTLHSLYDSIKSNITISTKLIDLINYVLNGKLKIKSEFTNMESSVNELNKMVNRLVFGVIVAALLMSSSIVINANIAPKIYGISLLGLAGYLGAAIAGFWLLISIIRSGKL